MVTLRLEHKPEIFHKSEEREHWMRNLEFSLDWLKEWISIDLANL